MARELKMCIINTDLVEEIRPLVGPQSEIMTRVGISWNSWIKVKGGLPIRQTVGERFRARVIEQAETLPGLKRRFPARRHGEAMDYRALEQNFLQPVPHGMS